MPPPSAAVLALPIVAIVLLFGAPGAQAVDASHQLVSTVDSGGNLEGCGVRVTGAESTLTVTLHRERVERTEGELEVMLEATGLPGDGAQLTLTTAVAGTISNFKVDQRQEGLHATAEIDGDSAALLMRDVLLSGATVAIATAGGEAPQDHRFDGPAPADVVRSYLQCAGNMAR